MSKWASAKLSQKKKSPPTKRHAIFSISETDWNKHFDPIDKEVYYVMHDAYPTMLTQREILERLWELAPDENEDYRIEDVADSIDLCLKAYVVNDMTNCEYRYQLKSSEYN